MNYFSHGRRFLSDPYFVAGTAVPDWLRVVDRQNRVRGKHAEPLSLAEHGPNASVARGILQHLHDDRWFHGTRVFAELSLDFSRRIRELLGPDDSFRPSFVGHILVELLLDATLDAEEPGLLDRYYATIEAVDPDRVAAAVSLIANRPAPTLSLMIRRFCEVRFLYDYAEDGKLLWRLNMVMRRVGLPDLPQAFCGLLPEARQVVRLRKTELLLGEYA